MLARLPSFSIIWIIVVGGGDGGAAASAAVAVAAAAAVINLIKMSIEVYFVESKPKWDIEFDINIYEM